MITEDDIWTLVPTDDELKKAADYAAITLPWTFNRMMKNTGHRGQIERALNIAKGIVAQEVLKRKFYSMGFDVNDELKSHRDEDLFDLMLSKDGSTTSLDVKTINYYSDYILPSRDAFSKKLLIENAAYPGPDWRKFFPMMLAHTQIGQDKGLYIFAIAESPDPRKNRESNGYPLTAFVYGELLPFLCSSKLCKAREAANLGFKLEIKFVSAGLFSGHCSLTVLGEWEGEKKNAQISLDAEHDTAVIGPFSCVAGFQIPSGSDFEGAIHIKVAENEYLVPVRNAARQNLNVAPQKSIALTNSDFVSLILKDYIVQTVGWTTRSRFLEDCKQYSGWVWPKDSVDRYKNQPWTQITEKDLKTITRIGFEGYIQRKPSGLKFGFLKTSGFGPGACCFVFPNTHGGGIKEHNLFVLPKDLTKMDDIVSEF